MKEDPEEEKAPQKLRIDATVTANMVIENLIGRSENLEAN